MTTDHLHIFAARQLVEAGDGPTCQRCGWKAPPWPDDLLVTDPTPPPNSIIFVAPVIEQPDDTQDPEEDA